MAPIDWLARLQQAEAGHVAGSIVHYPTFPAKTAKSAKSKLQASDHVDRSTIDVNFWRF